jgi:hypothetical protein
MNQKSRIEITPDHINVCATQRQVDLLISKAARRSEYMALLGEGFEYHGYDEHVTPSSPAPCRSRTWPISSMQPGRSKKRKPNTGQPVRSQTNTPSSRVFAAFERLFFVHPPERKITSECTRRYGSAFRKHYGRL